MAGNPSNRVSPYISNLPPPPTATSDPEHQADHSLLLTLATMPAHRHIRFFLQIDVTDYKRFEPPLTTADAPATYAYLRNHKLWSELFVGHARGLALMLHYQV